MATLKVIKSDLEHEQAVARLMTLMDINPATDSDDENELEVLSVLIEQYEHKHFPIDKPEPIEAIKFRMDQQGLIQKDMLKYFGSASKASEVLNGKRPLSISMIRKLHHELGIPAEILIQKPEIASEIEKNINSEINWLAFPLKEMQSRGYFGNNNYTIHNLKTYAEDLVRDFWASSPGCENLKPAMMRTSAHLINNNKKVNEYALSAWQVKVLKEANNQKNVSKFKNSTVNLEFMQRLVKESWSDKGPLIAREYLFKHGIHLVIEPHLDKTYLDGAVCINKSGNPIIALTMRHDRLDNFWFTLMHELAHIALHIDKNCEWFIDDLDIETTDIKEDEANNMAREALIPKAAWSLNSSSELSDIRELAKSLEIAPAIVFGRFAREYNQWPRLRKHIPKASSIFFEN
ncbi:MAG: ImmA/IrrE family metallo-endopeptidase [Pseudomonadota bacterium]